MILICIFVLRFISVSISTKATESREQMTMFVTQTASDDGVLNIIQSVIIIESVGFCHIDFKREGCTYTKTICLLVRHMPSPHPVQFFVVFGIIFIDECYGGSLRTGLGSVGITMCEYTEIVAASSTSLLWSLMRLYTCI
jgi:hypothetical protein